MTGRILSYADHRLQVYRRLPGPRAWLELAAIASGLSGFLLLMMGALT